MFRGKLYLGIALLSAVALVMGGCVSESGSRVEGAGDAQDAALAYLQEHEPQDVPGADIAWQEEDVTPPGLLGAVIKQFTSDEWTVKVSYPVLLPENTIYQVVVSSIKLGWHWKGTVEFDGSVTELTAFKQMSEEESQGIAEEFVRNSPTFIFDGIEDTLTLTETLIACCPYCWVFIFDFDSENAGYGDRTGQALAEVITPHRAAIAVEQLEITSAVMDDKWDMIKQEIAGEQEGTEGMLSVAEILENPVYDTEVKIYGEVGLLGELFCPCFELTSDGETLQVWYGLMVEDSGVERAPVSVEGIENGDLVVVTGELKTEGKHRSLNDFWASNIEKLVEVSCDDFTELRHISEEVEVAVGGSFTVALCSNPSTGFEWGLAQISDQTVLQQTDHQLVMPGPEPPPSPGTPGKEIWTFKAVKKDSSTISIEYSRPWEGGEEEEWTFNLTVVVN